MCPYICSHKRSNLANNLPKPTACNQRFSVEMGDYFKNKNLKSGAKT
ncbi:hypothetical protein HPS174_1065 [Glaesserella parasuis 174]|nr:hypothetical protein HPS174_1065 [Glaesserella parasuis 174]